MALLIAALASPHHRHEFWTACLESKGCVRYCGSSCFNKAKRSQKHRNLLPHAAKPLGTSSFDARTIPALSQCCYSNSTETVGDCWTEVPHGCAKFRNTPAATYWSCRRDCDARYLRDEGSKVEICHQTAELACGEQLRADGLLAPLMSEHLECKRLAMLYASCPSRGEQYSYDVERVHTAFDVAVAADPEVTASPDWPPPCDESSDSDVDGCWNQAGHPARARGRERLADWRTADSRRMVELFAFWVRRYQEVLLLALIDDAPDAAEDKAALGRTLADAIRPFNRWVELYGLHGQKEIVKRAVRHKVIATKDADAENARDEVGVADEHWRKPLEARRAIEAKAARLKARARYRDGYKGELR